MFAIVKNNEANDILQYLNRKHDSIKFTMSMAEQFKLQFLDMVVISDRTKQQYYTDIYHKPADTRLYSLYGSYVPAEYKLGTLNALLHRTWNYNQFDVDINKIRDKFYKLCYPKFILDKYIKHFVEKKIVATADESKNNNKRDEIIIRLPYIGEITKRLVKQLNKTVQDTGLNVTVRGVFKGEQKINNYFKLKDKTSRHFQ